MSVPGGSCPQCGATIGPGVLFCPRCGTGIPAAEGTRTTVAAQPGEPHQAGHNAQLDSLRQAALGAQAWLTGTDLALFENLASRADIFHVEASQLTRNN